MERNLSKLEMDVPPLRVRKPREPAEEARGFPFVGEEFQESRDVIVDLGVRDRPDPDRMERVLAEVEEAGIGLLFLRDANQVQVPLELDLRPLGSESKAGRACSQARPEDEDYRDDEAAEPV